MGARRWIITSNRKNITAENPLCIRERNWFMKESDANVELQFQIFINMVFFVVIFFVRAYLKVFQARMVYTKAPVFGGLLSWIKQVINNLITLSQRNQSFPNSSSLLHPTAQVTGSQFVMSSIRSVWYSDRRYMYSNIETSRQFPQLVSLNERYIAQLSKKLCILFNFSSLLRLQRTFHNSKTYAIAFLTRCGKDSSSFFLSYINALFSLSNCNSSNCNCCVLYFCTSLCKIGKKIVNSSNT